MTAHGEGKYDALIDVANKRARQAEERARILGVKEGSVVPTGIEDEEHRRQKIKERNAEWAKKARDKAAAELGKIAAVKKDIDQIFNIADVVEPEKGEGDGKYADMIASANERARGVVDKAQEKSTEDELIQAYFKSIRNKRDKKEKLREGEEDSRMEGLRIRENSLGQIIEARKKCDEIISRGDALRMSKEEFEEYFSTKDASRDFTIRADLKQQNVGDCYAVAAIHALSQSPRLFELVARSSMKRQDNGSWEVRIPPFGKFYRTVVISQEDIAPQENRNFSKWTSYLNPSIVSFIKSASSALGVREVDNIIDTRKTLQPVKGNEGLQVLEAAFIKHRFGERHGVVDRLAAEGGFGDDVLLVYGGGNFVRDSLHSNDPMGLRALAPDRIRLLDDYLEKFDPEINIATVNSRSKESVGATFYRGKNSEQEFISSHAYSITRVDQKEKMITLANPWDTSKPIKINFDEFKDNFSGLFAIRIDNTKLLETMKIT